VLVYCLFDSHLLQSVYWCDDALEVVGCRRVATAAAADQAVAQARAIRS
jgi:hypothetical protein